MARFAKQLVIGLLATLVAMITLAALFVVFVFTPYRYEHAHQLWVQQQPRHYQVEVSWASGWDVGNARVEIRDKQFVRALDLDTGQPLAVNKLNSASYFGSVDQLFTLIKKQVQPNWNWRNIVAHYIPQLAQKLKACTAPLGEVEYNSTYGYPANIWYNSAWCTNSFYSYSNVKITRFDVLP